MKVVIQRVKDASCLVNGEITGSIDNGFLLLVGITHEDTSVDVDYVVKKVVNMRIFEDDQGKMNLSLKDKGYNCLSVSQFTLYADTKKGNRPSFTKAAKPDIAKALYEEFNQKIEQEGIAVETGVFGEYMDLKFTNSGPVTIIVDSNNK